MERKFVALLGELNERCAGTPPVGCCEVELGKFGEFGKSVNRILMAFRGLPDADEFFRQSTICQTLASSVGSWQCFDRWII